MLRSRVSFLGMRLAQTTLLLSCQTDDIVAGAPEPQYKSPKACIVLPVLSIYRSMLGTSSYGGRRGLYSRAISWLGRDRAIGRYVASAPEQMKKDNVLVVNLYIQPKEKTQREVTTKLQTTNLFTSFVFPLPKYSYTTTRLSALILTRKDSPTRGIYIPYCTFQRPAFLSSTQYLSRWLYTCAQHCPTLYCPKSHQLEGSCLRKDSALQDPPRGIRQLYYKSIQLSKQQRRAIVWR